MRSGLLLALRLSALAYLSAVGGLVFWSQAPVVFGWQPRAVLTGSMMPVVAPGDVALVGPVAPGEELPPGRVVLVRDETRPSGSYLHRVVRVEADGRLVTRGDANSSDDFPAVDRGRVMGQLRLLVPRVGLPLIWTRDGRRAEVALVVLGTWAAIALALGLRATGDDDDRDDPDAGDPDVGHADGGVLAAAGPPGVPRAVTVV